MGYLGYLILGIAVLVVSLVLLGKSRRRVRPAAGLAPDTAAASAEPPPGRPPRRTSRFLAAAGSATLLASAGLFFFAWKANSAPADVGTSTAPDADEAPPWSGGPTQPARSLTPLPEQTMAPGWLRKIPSSPGEPIYDLPLLIKIDLPAPPPGKISSPTGTPGSGKAPPAAGKSATPSVPDVFNSFLSGLSELARKAQKPPAAKTEKAEKTEKTGSKPPAVQSPAPPGKGPG